jgi:hypothetical protein
MTALPDCFGGKKGDIMKLMKVLSPVLAIVLVVVLTLPQWALGQGEAKKVFKQEELDQMLAPVALYPDSLLTQILMASTYPLEVVQAERWAKQNKNLKGDALTKALEKQPWDPSVKSLVNFPQVLTMMNEKLDWTQKLGNAFLSQRKEVLATVQSLRAKAHAAGNLKTTKEQVVKVEKQIIIIESASPQVVYVPTYNPTVVYGAWWYPAYPPYYYYPPGYVAAPYVAFTTGVAVGAAWGYAWGQANWHGGDVNININQNTNINSNINRGKYATQYPAGGQGQWKKQATPSQQVQARQAYRGYSGSALTPQEQQKAQQKAQQAQQQQKAQQGAQQVQQQQQKQQVQQAKQTGGSAFEGMDRGGSSAKEFSSRGASSRERMSTSRGGGRSGGGSGGGRR